MNIIERNLNLGNMTYGNKPNTIVLHHAESSKCTVEDINRWHKGNGWAGIGYHYFVKKDGSIYKGRPDNAIGAHARGHNTNSLGICAEGRYMVENMPQAQKNSIIELCKYLKSKYGISRIYGHGELMSTDCPGANFPLQEIKNTVLNGQSSTNATNSGVSVGSKIKITGANYATGQAIPNWVKNNTYTVQQISGSKALIKEILSWVYIKDLKVVSSNSNSSSKQNTSNWISLDGKTGTCTGSGVRVRSSKDTSTSKNILGHLYKGEKVRLYRLEGDWVHIYYPSHGGYIHKNYIKY
ncbi:N-acetylmuramoyl-L-alanine amidase [Haloimpatiens massiliensis]|uniref:N-acetylmuramoyl-L-alanine amidase n=1 Tax=Haloimpatiens massiliensis TaxID=1658110 RepID=UPI000C843235|nr:N-acetylmuramoyl-L-alanine amidase [Haloimpatiens massiliensis]